MTQQQKQIAALAKKLAPWIGAAEVAQAGRQLAAGERIEDVLRRMRDWAADAKHESQCDGRASMMAE